MDWESSSLMLAYRKQLVIQVAADLGDCRGVEHACCIQYCLALVRTNCCSGANFPRNYVQETKRAKEVINHNSLAAS